jgi:hypothetical protein
MYNGCKTKFENELGNNMKLKDLILKEAEETEISKKVADLVKKMESLTDKNQHNEALAELAKFFGNKKMEKVMKAIGDIHDELKTMPYGLTQFRNEVMKDLLTLAKQRLNGKEYEAVYRVL